MKKIIRCKKCQERVVVLSVGFSGKSKLMCGQFDKEITLEDGCTFGIEGPSKYTAQQNFEINLGSDAKVNGSSFENW